jgi:60 kDa SS-A/Ro ribonucleoprotein
MKEGNYIMANRKLFASAPAGRVAPPTDTVNSAGGRAYKAGPKEALAQYVATGCLGATFYASAEEQLDEILKLASDVSPEFVAQAAVYGRRSAFMKDTPALLLAHLATRGPEGLAALKAAFNQVVDNPKMLRTFVQIMRSGKVGRKSLGTAPKTLVKAWFDARSDVQLFRATGDKPSLADVIKMVHPKPQNAARKALYALLVGKSYDLDACDALVQEFEAWKKDPSRPVPDVPFLMLTNVQLDKKQWVAIARSASWQTARMNLNTFLRHGVFEDKAMIKVIAAKLRDESEIAHARVFPYQLLVAYRNVSGVPMEIQSALQDAMEIATKNVPVIDGTVAVFPDVSGSMCSPVTGARGSATTKVECKDVAALVAATILRRNPGARVVPFKEDVINLRLNPKDSIVTIAEQIAKCGSGGTNCSAPLRLLNSEKAKADLIVYVSDNESWMDPNVSLNSYSSGYTSSPTSMMAEWEKFRVRNPAAKLACIDLAPNGSRQAPTRKDILNVGGFSDEVFTLLSEFHKGSGGDHWAKKIGSVQLGREVPVAPVKPTGGTDWVTL